MPSNVFLRASLATWRKRLRYRQRRLKVSVRHHRTNSARKWRRLVDEAHAKVSRRERQLAAKAHAGTFLGSPVPGLRPHTPDHETAGLPGYPAFDYMARAGTACVAPVSGRVVKLSGHDPAGGPTDGPHGPFGWSVYIDGDNGRTYFLTHMGTRTVRIGDRVKQGQRIGSVGNYVRWGGADHIHMGVHG